MALAPASEIVAALRDYGLTVVERPHWRILGTGYPFDPFAQAFHHDAFTEAVSDARALQIMEDGRPDLRGPLCNGWIDSSSVVYLIAYGNANHAGRNEADVIDRLRQGLAPVGDAREDSDGDTVVGNSHLWGWECRNAGTGHDPWEQLDAMERAGAALADACGWPTQAIAAHRELTARKIDVAGIDMHRFRDDVARITRQPLEDDMREIIKGDGQADLWITDYITRRRITPEHAGTLVFFGKAAWNRDTNAPFVWPQHLVDRITAIDDGIWTIAMAVGAVQKRLG